MSRLVLVRHGQARFFTDDYDRLSEIGVAQSRVLGEYWLSRGEEFDEVYVGTLKRQRETAEAVGEVLHAAGRAWPVHEVLPGLDEYPGSVVQETLLPILCERDERFVEMKAAYENAPEGEERYRTFHRLLTGVMQEWIRGDYEANGLMPWTEFRDGVLSVLRMIMGREGSGRRVAVFTSGGPIGVTVQSVLQAPDRMAGELNWRIRNCSVTELTFSGERVALDCFNGVGHLTDPEMLTYR